MPSQARPSGMWRGSEPETLSDLTYCESKVMNLARVHVNVKEDFFVLSSYELTSRPHAIYYHQKNIVVYHSKIALRVKHHGNTLESMRVARGHPDPDVGVRRNHAVSSVRRTH
jgi:hypothetical protein